MDFIINGGNAGAKINVRQYNNNGIEYAELSVDLKEAAIPETLCISFKVPAVGCYSVWSPSARQSHSIEPEWRSQQTESSLAGYMPLHQLLSLDGKNRLCIAVSDAAVPISIKTGICEFDASVSCKIEFFTRLTAKRSRYRAVIRLDTRSINYYDSIYDAVAWWENECGYKPAGVPEGALRPMNSTWYSMHHNLSADEIVRQCRLSKALGMETVIIDDGWQMDESESVSGCYSRCGDWKPSLKKMGEMSTLVKRIHETGTKVMLWYSVPYIGINSENYERFQDKILEHTGDFSTFFALDPRYKEVRDFITETYVNAVREWGLDGLKLDFIDAFTLSGRSLEADERRDYVSLEEAIDALMSGVTAALTAVKPDIMIEFRQTYIGPAIRKYGNMLRVSDCPADAIKNRTEVVNLRLTSGKTTVHSDMVM